MTIKSVAKRINEMAKNYKMSSFQKLRQGIKKFSKTPSKLIFAKQTTFGSYAYHYGGRTELQYNIAEEEDKFFRYGVAFSLEKGKTLPDPVGALKSKILRANKFISKNRDRFSDFYTWAHENHVRGVTRTLRPIDTNLIKPTNFIFIGKYIKKSIDKLNAHDYDEILKTFDRLLELYKYVESDSSLEETTSGSENEINAIFRFTPGHKSRKESMQANYMKHKSKVDLAHNRIVKSSYQYLSKIYGKKNVRSELPHLGSFIDLVVKDGRKYIFYEFKINDSIKLCIREALPQLLEYAYYPYQNNANKLIIVSPNIISDDVSKYLSKLRHDFKIPVYYKRYNKETMVLEDMEF